jgi:hypothetical protein
MKIRRIISKGLVLSGMPAAQLRMLEQVALHADPSESPAASERLYQTPVKQPQHDADEELVEDWQEFVMPDLRQEFTRQLDCVANDLRQAQPESTPSPLDDDSLDDDSLDDDSLDDDSLDDDSLDDDALDDDALDDDSLDDDSLDDDSLDDDPLDDDPLDDDPLDDDALDDDPLREDEAKAGAEDDAAPAATYGLIIPFDHIESWYGALNQARLVMQARYEFPETENLAAMVELLTSKNLKPYLTSRFYMEIQGALLDLGMDVA